MAYGLPASRESVETLLEISGVETIVPTSRGQLELTVRQVVTEALKGEARSAEQQRRAEAVQAKVLSQLRPEFSWGAIKPRYVSLYLDTFDQAEIDGMIAFYRSPIGKSYLAKQPSLLDGAVKLNSSIVESVLPKITEAVAVAAASPDSAIESANRAKVIDVTCLNMIAPAMPREAMIQRVSGVVFAFATILRGIVTDVKIVSGPEIFHESVVAAMRQYKCTYSDTAIRVNQEFSFRTEAPSSAATPAVKTP